MDKKAILLEQRYTGSGRLHLRFAWLLPAKMVAFLICGFFAALGHHLYYEALNQNPVADSELKWRPQVVGTALAFFVKTTLVAAVQISYKQRCWVRDMTMSDRKMAPC